MRDIQKKNKGWRGEERLPIITDLVDPRPRRQVKFLNDYSLLLETATFSAGYTEEPQGASDLPGVHIRINRLTHKILKSPLDVLVEPDDKGFVARTPELPLNGYGQDRIEAIRMLKRQIESFFDELLEKEPLTKKEQDIKRFLSEKISTNT